MNCTRFEVRAYLSFARIYSVHFKTAFGLPLRKKFIIFDCALQWNYISHHRTFYVGNNFVIEIVCFIALLCPNTSILSSNIFQRNSIVFMCILCETQSPRFEWVDSRMTHCRFVVFNLMNELSTKTLSKTMTKTCIYSYASVFHSMTEDEFNRKFLFVKLENLLFIICISMPECFQWIIVVIWYVCIFHYAAIDP